ncbi:MAG: transposase [Clostridia bacterium]|nr:transposase [Clostridia bacterium]
MSRGNRQISDTNYYHIMLRGINKQNIFEDDEDRKKFIDIAFHFAKETETKICAWCLMSNHVHLLIYSEKIPEVFIKRVGCTYVPYFNKKYERVGHLFQDRYKSEAVNNDRYLIGVVRYIHKNPQKAGICNMESYEWSSYRDYLYGGRTKTDALLDLMGGKSGFISFMNQQDSKEYLEYTSFITEKEAVAIAKAVLPGGLFDLGRYERKTRDEYIRLLINQGIRASQICRITGLGKTIVYSALKKEK